MFRKRFLTASELAHAAGCTVQNISISKTRGALICKNGRYDMQNLVNRSWLETRKADKRLCGRRSITTTPEQRAEIESTLEIKRRTALAEMSLQELKVQRLQKTLYSIEFFNDFLNNYLDVLSLNLSKMAADSIPCIGSEILAEKEILPCHIETFVSSTLAAMHSAKLAVMKKIEHELKTGD